MLGNIIAVFENDGDALPTDDGMSGGGVSGAVGGVATAPSAVGKVFGYIMICYCLLQILVGLEGITVSGLELGKFNK